MRNFMYGRYGIDELGKFLSAVMLILYFIGMLFFKGSISVVLRCAAVAVFIYFCYRAFSRDSAKRYDENRVYLDIRQNITAKLRGLGKNKRGASKTSAQYSFFTCDKCSTITRVPKGKGKIIITCPVCKNKFEARS